MRIIITLFAIAALGFGAISAWHWYRSAVEPPPATAKLATLAEDESGRTPLDHWIEAVAKRNRKAALWTAGAVVSAAIATLLSVWSV